MPQYLFDIGLDFSSNLYEHQDFVFFCRISVLELISLLYIFIVVVS